MTPANVHSPGSADALPVAAGFPAAITAGSRVRTSIRSMLDLGPRHLVLVVAETLFPLGAAILVLHFLL